MIVDHSLTLTKVRVYNYRMPLKRAYGTARGVTKAGVNFLVQLTGERGGRLIEGVGECQPRHKLTGDGGTDRAAAWNFLRAAADDLHGRSLHYTDRETAVIAVRRLMTEIGSVAMAHADDNNRDRPYRGTMLGIEVALLDIVCRSLDLQISELLGKRRETVAISISTISSSTKLEEVEAKVIKQKRYPITRVKGTGDLTYDLKLIECVSRANRSVGHEKPIWLDINEALDPGSASRLITELTGRMERDEIPSSVVLEGVLPKDKVAELPQLQRQADDECRAVEGSRDLDLRIMPDEGLWDVGDLVRVNARGGCRALNIKAPKAGGLLASLDLANAAVEADPDIHICIGGMLGTSDITAWALHNLARAMPRLDYITTVPPTNVKERIAEPLATYRERGSNVIAAQTEPGLGSRLVVEKVLPFVNATYEPPRGVPVSQDTAPASRPAQLDGVVKVNNRVPLADSTDTMAWTLTLVGDTSLGDVHVNAKGGDLRRRLDTDPMSFFAGVQPLVSDQDALVLNLETVLADSPTSPFEGRKRFLGWDSPRRTIQCLQQLRVTAASLANNHTTDYGPQHLLRTSELLSEAGIASFGAGSNQANAAAPLSLALPFGGTERNVHVIGLMEEQSRLRDEFRIYAGDNQAGVNRMSTSVVSQQIRALRATDPDSLIMLFPHWGGNYKWARVSTQRTASSFIDAGADLIIGHGAHMIQQCTFAGNSAIVYSLGNFVFNWAGRFQKFDAPPFGLVARLQLRALSNAWNVVIRLYPILSDNKKTGYRPRPVDDNEFDSLLSLLQKHDLDGSFGERAEMGKDRLGRYIAYGYRTGSQASEDHASQPPIRLRGQDNSVLEAFSPGSTTYLLAQAVLNRGLPHRVEYVSGSTRSGTKPRQVLRFTVSDRDYFVRGGTIAKAGPDGLPGRSIDGRAVSICKRKDVMNGILGHYGFSVPNGMSFAADDLRDALLYFEAIVASCKDGVCVKPVRGNKGRSIHVNVTDRETFRAAFEDVAANFSTILVEESVRGEMLRFLYVGGNVVAVRRAMPASVVGDGHRSVAELVDTKNEWLQERGADRHMILKLGGSERAHLTKAGWNAGSIPANGERVYLSPLSNRHAAAEIIDCTEQVHPSYFAIVEDATARIPDIAVCGVDVMVHNFTEPAATGNHYFIELNTTPGLRGHHAPSEGAPRDVAGTIIDYVAAALP